MSATAQHTPTPVKEAQVDPRASGGLKKSLRLLFVYTLATGAIFTFVCYWDGIFLSYCGPEPRGSGSC